MRNLFKRTLYLLYYLKQLDRQKFSIFFSHVKETNGISKCGLYADIIKSVYKYNIGIMDYFIFKFYEKSENERHEWAGTGFMYEYHLKMNPKSTRHILLNKIEFYKAYSQFVSHAVCTLEDIKLNNSKAVKVLANQTGKVVVKDAMGQCGWDVEVLHRDDYDRLRLIEYMTKKGFTLAEEFICQHHELDGISESGLNTIRIITQLNKKGEVDILGARLRVSVDSHVDNLASGNIAVPIDLESGKVCGVGVYSDITKGDVNNHPISGVELIDFQMPFWAETCELAKKAALSHPENRSIGWDVAINDSGPEFIEGNHNWCKILWQLPVKKGLKDTLYKYL